MAEGEPVEGNVLKQVVEQAQNDPDQQYRQARKDAEAQADEVTTQGVFWYINGQRVMPGMPLMAYDDRAMAYSLASVVDFNERALTVTFNDGFRFVFGKSNPPLKLLEAPDDTTSQGPPAPEADQITSPQPWHHDVANWGQHTSNFSDLEYLDRANERMFEMYLQACRLHERSLQLIVDTLKK